MRLAFLVALTASLALAPMSARAADEPNVAAAKKTFAAGAQAYREARYKEAIELFLSANRLDPHPELIFNVGQAYEKLGDVPNALRSYRDYLRLSPGATDRVTVEASIKNLEARLREKGVQQITIFSTPAGATLELDRKSVGQTPWTGEIAPGRHVVILKATGFADTAKEFVLIGDRAMDLDIALSNAPIGAGATALPAAPSRAPAPAARPAPDAPKPGGMPVKPWTFTALGVGVAGLGAAIGLEVARKGAENGARADRTQVGYAEKYSTMVGYQTAARVLVGVGAAFTAIGGVLLFVDLRANARDPDRKAAVGCFGPGCGVFAAGSF
jgi:tetratricopeptide (TPR) repeat protein